MPRKLPNLNYLAIAAGLGVAFAGISSAFFIKNYKTRPDDYDPQKLTKFHVPTQISDNFQSVVQGNKQKIQQSLSSGKEKVTEVATQNMKQAQDIVEQTKSVIQQTVLQTKQKAQQFIQQNKQKAQQALTQTKQKVVQIYQDNKEKAEQIVQQKRKDIESAVSNTKQNIKQSIEQNKNKAKQVFESGKQKIESAANEAKQNVVESIQENKRKLQKKVQAKKQQIKSKVVQVKQKVNEQVQQNKQKIQSGLQSIKEKIQQKIQQIKEVIEQKKEEATSKINRPIRKLKRQLQTYESISSLPQFPLDSKLADNQYAIVVIDMPYTPKFSQEIIDRVNNIVKKRNSNEQLKVYKLDVSKPGVSKKIKDIHGADLRQQTIILMKNPYQDKKKMINFDFDMYVQYPNLISIYLSDLNVISNDSFRDKYEQKIKNMSPNETFVLMVADLDNKQETIKKQLTTKYIEMELGLHSLEGMKIHLIDQKLAKEKGILENPKQNSLHILRKKNQYTYGEPNRWLFEGQPFYVIENISLYDKNRKISIPKYLSKIETFNSMQFDAPLVCTIVVDRNKIHPQEQRELLKVFNDFKRKQTFPFLSYVLRYAEVQYPGQKQQDFHNKKWMIKIAKLNDIDNQLMVHDAKTREDLQKINIDENKWQTNTYQYLYKYPEINEESLKIFIGNILQEKEPSYYKSQKSQKLQNLNKLNSQNFNSQILQKKDKSHLVFQYSDHCASCQMLAPVIQYTANVFSMFPDLKIQMHKLNCDKNRVKGQPYSPYTPNLYYYSKKWGNKWPLRYPLLETINDSGIKGIYQFCEITQSLGQIKRHEFQKHIQAVKKADIKIQQFL